MTTRTTFAKLAAAAAAAIVLGAGLSACTEAAAPAADPNCTPKHAGLTTVKPGTLTVGVPENMPWTRTSGTDAEGMEIDIVKLLAKDECLALAFVPITYGNGIPMISEQKQVDMISGGWYVTEARAQQVGFTTPTYFDAMGIVTKDGVDTVSGLESVGNVGSGAGFSWEADMTTILGDKMKTYPGTIEAKQDLLNGRIQAALDGYSVAKYAYKDTEFKVELSKPDPRVKITTEQPVAAFPVSKDNKALSDALSEGIDGYRADGTLAQILGKYDLDASLVVPADKAAASLR